MVEVKGNEEMITKEIRVSSFVRLHLLTSGIIEVFQADEEKVIIETDENLVHYFEVINSGRTLYVSSEGKLNKPLFTKCRVSIFLRNINTIDISHEEATVICKEGIKSSFPISIKIREAHSVSLSVDSPGISLLHQAAGHVTLSGKCRQAAIKVQGEGDLDAAALEAEELQLKHLSGAEVKVHADKLIDINQLGDGPIYYSGPGVLRDISVRGEGIVKHV